MNRIIIGAVVTLTLVLGPSMSARAQTPTPPPDAGQPAPAPPATVPMASMTSTTGTLTAEVVQVEGTNLVVKMASGELRAFNVNPERRFVVDGKPLAVGQLKPGTMLTATFTTTPPAGAPVTEVTGKVWYVAGNAVILTLPDGTNKSYNVPASFRFDVNGQPATVRDLRKGMNVTAHRIPELPAVEFCYDVEITGTAKKK
ncbi:MAG TPA: hypothetical protein VMQ62_15675 [Dongiaceae bacterium]|nr:hypothetical protein [Dongiaceae bacterium]